MNKNVCNLAMVIILMCGIPRFAVADESAAPIVSAAQQYVAKAKEEEQKLDFNAAIPWYQKAAGLGDAKSMYELGWIYFGAHDIPGRHFTDYNQAAAWFQKAANLDYAPAITQLGVMYSADGSEGVPEDHVKAAQLYLKAAQMGDAQAMNNLGVMYSQGRGVPRDISEAVRLWKKAVALGGPAGKAAQTWLDAHDGKAFCIYCGPSSK